MTRQEIIQAKDECKNNNTLTKEQKDIKMSILNIIDTINGYEISYNLTKNQYINYSQQLEHITNGEFKLGSTIDETRHNIVQFLSNTYLYKKMQEKASKDQSYQVKTFEDLKKWADYYELNVHFNANPIKLAIQLQNEIDTMIQLEKMELFIVEKWLRPILGDSIISRYNTRFDKDGGQQETKTEKEYYNNWQIAMRMIAEYKDILGDIVYTNITNLINQTFEIYINGHKSLDLESKKTFK